MANIRAKRYYEGDYSVPLSLLKSDQAKLKPLYKEIIEYLPKKFKGLKKYRTTSIAFNAMLYVSGLLEDAGPTIQIKCDKLVHNGEDSSIFAAPTYQLELEIVEGMNKVSGPYITQAKLANNDRIYFMGCTNLS